MSKYKLCLIYLHILNDGISLFPIGGVLVIHVMEVEQIKLAENK